MGCLINYEVAHLNILYFYNFPCHTPRLIITTLENVGFFPLSPLPFVFHTFTWCPLHKENQEIKMCNKLGKVFKNFLISNILAI